MDLLKKVKLKLINLSKIGIKYNYVEIIGENMSTKIMRFDKTIDIWDEGIPLGNGDLGCLIWNQSDKLRFSIDKSGIWDTSDSPENEEYFTYDTIRRLVKEKKQKELTKKFDLVYSRPAPTKLPTGKIIIDLGVKEKVVSTLDFERAEAMLEVGSIKLKTFTMQMKTTD